MNSYFASELFSSASDFYLCPNCNGNLNRKLIKDEKVKGCVVCYCLACKSNFEIKTPNITKKLVYLDSFFLSKLFLQEKLRDDEKRWYSKFKDKLDELINRQLIQICISDIHAKEFSRFKQGENLWSEVISFASGLFAIENSRENQSKRLIKDTEENFPWSDVLDTDPHAWRLENILLTKLWAISLNQRTDPGIDTLNKNYRNILDNMSGDVDQLSSPTDCFDYILNLTCEDMVNAIDYVRLQTELIEMPSESGYDFERLCDLVNHPGAKLTGLVYPIISDEYDPALKIQSLDKLKKLFEFQSLTITELLIIAMESVRVFRFISAMQSKTQSSDKKFSEKQGESAINDSMHISLFAAYVDTMVIDNRTFNLIQEDIVKRFLGQLKCEFFHPKEFEKFDAWLDDLLSLDEDEEIFHTRRLLIGLSPFEYKYQLHKLTTNTVIAGFKKLIEDKVLEPKQKEKLLDILKQFKEQS